MSLERELGWGSSDTDCISEENQLYGKGWWELGSSLHFPPPSATPQKDQSQICAEAGLKRDENSRTKWHCEGNKEVGKSPCKAVQSTSVVCREPVSIKLFFDITKPTHCFNFAPQATESTATYLCTIKHFWLNGITSSTWHLIWCHADYTLEMKAASVRLLISLMQVTISWSASTLLPNPLDTWAFWHSEQPLPWCCRTLGGIQVWLQS